MNKLEEAKKEFDQAQAQFAESYKNLDAHEKEKAELWNRLKPTLARAEVVRITAEWNALEAQTAVEYVQTKRLAGLARLLELQYRALLRQNQARQAQPYEVGGR